MDEKEFMQKQIAEIEREKWLEGERIGRDPGEEFVREWIKKHAEEFREIHNPSGEKFDN
jgi:hypothetical protein